MGRGASVSMTAVPACACACRGGFELTSLRCISREFLGRVRVRAACVVLREHSDRVVCVRRASVRWAGWGVFFFYTFAFS